MHVELDRDRISCASRGGFPDERADDTGRNERPERFRAVDVEDDADVVLSKPSKDAGKPRRRWRRGEKKRGRTDLEDDIQEVTAVDQPRRLEEVLVLLLATIRIIALPDLRRMIGVLRVGLGSGNGHKPAVLIDLKEPLSDVVVVADAPREDVSLAYKGRKGERAYRVNMTQRAVTAGGIKKRRKLETTVNGGTAQ